MPDSDNTVSSLAAAAAVLLPARVRFPPRRVLGRTKLIHAKSFIREGGIQRGLIKERAGYGAAYVSASAVRNMFERPHSRKMFQRPLPSSRFQRKGCHPAAVSWPSRRPRIHWQ